MDTSRRLTLNVGGQLFQTTVDTLRSLPSTRLGRLATDTSLNHQPDTHLFFDRNPEIMNSILDLYRTGELHLPKHLCSRTLERELQFWEIPRELIHECCYKTFDSCIKESKIWRKIDKFLTCPYETRRAVRKLSRWNRVWLIMEKPQLCTASKVWSAIFFSMVLVSVLAYMLHTTKAFRTYEPWVHAWAADHNMTVQVFTSTMTLAQQHFASEPVPSLHYVEHSVFGFFVLEFVVRLATCPSKAYFFRQFRSWLDLFLIVQHGVSLTLEHVVMTGWENFSDAAHTGLHMFMALSTLRVIRVFYLARNVDSMQVLLLSTKASLKALMMLAVSLLSMATMFGAFIYVVELLEESFAFQSIPYGVWYAVVTMTTVGYGDFVPVTPGGRVIGGLCALSGLIVLALPITVIATKYKTYRDNITARKQRMTRVTFLKDNPGFCTRLSESCNESGATQVSATREVNCSPEKPLDAAWRTDSGRPGSWFGSGVKVHSLQVQGPGSRSTSVNDSTAQDPRLCSQFDETNQRSGIQESDCETMYQLNSQDVESGSKTKETTVLMNNNFNDTQQL